MDYPRRRVSETAGGIVLPDGATLITRTVHEGTRVQVVLARSLEDGATWADVSTIVEDDRGTDLGDGCLRQLRDASPT